MIGLLMLSTPLFNVTGVELLNAISTIFNGYKSPTPYSHQPSDTISYFVKQIFADIDW
jgi:hypothetical protein